MTDLTRVKGISFYFDAKFGKNKGKVSNAGSATTFFESVKAVLIYPRNKLFHHRNYYVKNYKNIQNLTNS